MLFREQLELTVHFYISPVILVEISLGQSSPNDSTITVVADDETAADLSQSKLVLWNIHFYLFISCKSLPYVFCRYAQVVAPTVPECTR